MYGIPRGNLSDLYPVWLGSRELLRHGRNPYGPEVTREIQAGYYGRPLNALNGHDPVNRQAFAYPVYVAFVLAPTIQMPFEEVQALFRWVLAFLTAVSVWLWLRFLRWTPGWITTAAIVLLTLGTFAAVQGIRLQQLSLLVAALVAGALALLASGHLVLPGILLAIAMIKPQLTIFLAVWLLIWTMGSVRARVRFALSLLVSLAALILGGEVLLPGWIAAFRNGVNAYLQYAAGGSLLSEMLGPSIGEVLAAVIVASIAIVCWRARRTTAQDRLFVRITSLVLAGTLLMIPMFPPHYQLLLVPAILLLLRDWRKASSGTRKFIAAGMILIAWQYLSAAVLAIASFFSTEGPGRFWALPLWTNILLPIPITASLALLLYERHKEHQLGH